MKRIKYLLLILSLVFVASMLCACLHIELSYTHQFNEWSEIKPAKCTQAGLKQRSCSCGVVETRDIPALGHDYTASPTYAWSDDNSACTATIVCGNNCGVDKVVNATVSSERTPATCTKGSTIYTATFTEQGYATQTQVVEIAALGHNYVNRVCTNCGDTVSYSQDLEYELSNNETYYTVTGIGDCKDTTVVIPDTYNGKPVTSIGDWAFAGCHSLTSVTIPSSVTSIGNYAFHNCHSLIEVCNKSSLNITAGSSDNGRVGYYAKHIITDEADSFLTNVDDFIFYDDGTNVYLVKYVGKDTKITLPRYNDQNYTIHNYAFYNNYKITDITIPSSVTSIGVNAFYYCSSLTSITIPSSVTSIGIDAFCYCTSLTSITIPSSVTSIGDWTFGYCSSLTSVTFEKGSKCASIGVDAFYYCTSLTSIVIPEGVTSIGYSVFDDCYSLIEVCNKSSLNITAGSTDNGEVGYYAKHIITDEADSFLTNVDDFIFYDDGTNVYLVKYVGEDTEITLPRYNDKNYTIYDYAFYNDKITSITIPSTVTSIGDYAFFCCYSLIEVCNKSSLNITAGSTDNGFVGCYAKHIITDEADSYLKTVDNFVFYDDGTNVYLVKYVGEDTEITLPRYNDKNYTIHKFAFYNNYKITDITIPSSVTSIGDRVFEYCSSLTSVTFEEGSKCTSIGEMAFSNCTRLTSITIPSSVTSIGDWAFYYCDGLTSITIPSSVTSIGWFAFYECYSLTDVYYTGTQGQWNSISIGGHNEALTGATIHYNYKG